MATPKYGPLVEEAILVGCPSPTGRNEKGNALTPSLTNFSAIKLHPLSRSLDPLLTTNSGHGSVESPT